MRSSKRVYVVDDDQGVLQSTRWLLEAEGFAIETFSSAAHFLATYDPAMVDCVILDLDMPEMDGLQVQKELRGRADCPPIIFASSCMDASRREQALHGGAIGFLEKPVDDEALCELLRQALERDRQTPGRQPPGK